MSHMPKNVSHETIISVCLSAVRRQSGSISLSPRAAAATAAAVFIPTTTTDPPPENLLTAGQIFATALLYQHMAAPVDGWMNGRSCRPSMKWTRTRGSQYDSYY